MNKTKQILAIALCALLAASCSTGNKGKPESDGLQGQVMVVLPKHLWEGRLGDSIINLLAEPVYGLPGAEPMFDLRHQSNLEGFTPRSRHLVIVNVDSTVKKTTMSMKDDVYASHQIVFSLQAPKVDSALACLTRYTPLITERFLKHDLDDYVEYYRRIISESDRLAALNHFNVDIVIPREYKLAVEKDNFLWFAREERDMIIGLLMWKTPYTATEQLSDEQLLANINKQTFANVRIRDSAYLATEPLVPPFYTTYDNNGVYTVLMRGLWGSQNMNATGPKVFMGGPYVSMSIVDSQRSQVVTGFGFVFFPRKDKRNYVRMLEAILSTMKPVK